MLPGSQKRKPKNSSKVNLLISLTFHGILVLTVLYYAARQGWIGKTVQKIAVEMIREKPKETGKTQRAAQTQGGRGQGGRAQTRRSRENRSAQKLGAAPSQQRRAARYCAAPGRDARL